MIFVKESGKDAEFELSVEGGKYSCRCGSSLFKKVDKEQSNNIPIENGWDMYICNMCGRSVEGQ